MSGDEDYIRDEESGEWRSAADMKAAAAATPVVRDAAGIRSVRLARDPDQIDGRHDSITELVLRTEFACKR